MFVYERTTITIQTVSMSVQSDVLGTSTCVFTTQDARIVFVNRCVLGRMPYPVDTSKVGGRDVHCWTTWCLLAVTGIVNRNKHMVLGPCVEALGVLIRRCGSTHVRVFRNAFENVDYQEQPECNATQRKGDYPCKMPTLT